MKTSKRIFHILLSLLLLHGVTVGFKAEISVPGTAHHEENLLALPSTHLFSFTTKHENGRAQFHAIDHVYFGGDGSILSTVYRLAESTLCNKLSTHFFLTKEHMPSLQATSIIFPFHAFP